MSVVGEFPGINYKRRMIRGAQNPLDKTTIVSIYPKYIDEMKVTIQPGRFIIQPGSPEKPSILTVGPSSWWRDIDEDQPLLEIPQSSVQVAESVVKDYCNGILGCNMTDKMPGLFFILGEVNKENVTKQYSNEIQKALVKQRNFYSELVKMADSLWARSSGNPLAVSDDMRMAAKELNLTNTKDWMKDFSMIEMTRCTACGSLKNPDYPVCSSCRAIDMSHPKAKDLKFVSQQ